MACCGSQSTTTEIEWCAHMVVASVLLTREMVQPGVACDYEVDGSIFVWFKMPTKKFVTDDWMALKPLERQILLGLEHLDGLVGHIFRQV